MKSAFRLQKPLAFWLLLAASPLTAATIALNNTAGDYLEVSGVDPSTNTYVFSGTIAPYDASALTRGLRYVGGGTVYSAASFQGADLNGSPLTGAAGATTVSYSGYWQGDGGNAKAQLVLTGGALWQVKSPAHLDFISAASLFTRQLWVYGDGTGTLELDAGFIADRTANGTIADGIASIRLSNNTLITHHTQSLPVAPRPDGAGGLQTNGHLVFENAGGSVWITRSNPQTYAGAVWIGVDATFRTETDLTHTGITQYSSHYGSYWADNAFQTTAENVQLTKTGAADLILAAETAFLPGTVFTVEQGGVVLQTDPAAGWRKNSSHTLEGGPNLQLVVGREGAAYRAARARFEAPLSRIASLTSMQGRVELLGIVRMQSFSSNHQDDLPDQFPPPPLVQSPSIVHFQLDTVSGKLEVAGEAALGGELLITRADGFDPDPGTSIDLIVAGSFASGPNGVIPRFESVDDRTGLGLGIEYLADRVRVTTTRHARTTGVVIDEDWTDGAFDAPGWSIVDAQVAFRATGRPAIPAALTRPANVSFVWNAATLDVPAFFVGDDEVLVIRMTTFSDIAYNNQEYAKPEVACLHLNEHAQFGHDHATEISRNYFTLGNWQQLKPSVENDDAIAFPGIHLAGGDSASTLGQNDTSLTIFRPQGAATNSEAHGMRNQQQATHARALQHWNNILISLPRTHDPNKAPVLRTGVALADALVGMSHAHVGVTKRTDANLDYATDAIDFIFWNSYRGLGGTLQWSGDFDNDGGTDSDDLVLWSAAAGGVHDPDFSRPVAVIDLTNVPGSGTGTPPSFTYDRGSGELTLTTGGSAISALVVPAPAAADINPAISTGAWWQARVRGAEQWVDTSLAGISGSVVIAILPPLLSAADFGPVTFGYAAGGGGTTTVAVTGEPLLPQLAEAGGDRLLELVFTRSTTAPPIRITGFASHDLAFWSSEPDDVEVVAAPNGDGTETVTVRALAPVAPGNPPVFLRTEFGFTE